MSNTVQKNSSISANYIYNLIYDVLVLIVPLITTPYISRVLSPDSIGIYSYTYSIIMYFTAFVVSGTKSYAIKRIARSTDKEEATLVFWDIFIFRALSGILALYVYYGYVFLFAENKTVAVIQSFYIIAVIFDISWFFQGVENFKTIIFRNLVIKVISLIAIFALVKDNGDLLIYIISLSGLTLVGNLTLWGYLPKYLTKVSISKLRPFTGIKEIMVLFIPTLALQIYSAIDKTMLGAITNKMTENGYYEQTNKIIGAALTAITSLSIVGLPRISALFAEKEYDSIKRCMENSYRFVFFLSFPMIFGICGISDILIPWFLGDAYSRCIPLLCISSLLFLIIGLSNITGFQYLVATDRQNIYSVSIVAGTVINVLLNRLLIPSLLSFGAALASVISEACVLAIQLSYVTAVKHEFNVPQLFKESWKYFFSGAFMFAVIYLLKSVLPDGFVGLCVLIALGISVYMILLLILRDSMTINFIKRQIICRLFKGRNNTTK